MSSETSNGLKNHRRRYAWIVAIAVVAVAGIAGVARSTRSGTSANTMPTFSVRQGPLTISVVESGTIQAQEQEIIKNEVEGQATIIYLIPEGTLVEKGELLVELEASRLQDDLVEQKIRVQNAEAAFVRARENLEVVKNQTKSDISRAELDYKFAQGDQKQYLEGEYPQELKEAESRIILAREELERADEKLKWSEQLYKEKFIAQTELDADRLTHKRAKLDDELARTAKQLLENYTHARQIAQLSSDVDQAKMALERVKLKANADIVQAQADHKAKEAEFGQQQSKLEKVKRQISKTKIYAPRAGLVVYASSAKSSHRGNDDPLDEGSSVRERQELIYLPTADDMMAELQIHESNLDKVRIGLPVRVTVDALKGKTFMGLVSKIAPLPNAYRMRMNPDLKVYDTQVRLEGKNGDLRSGMSCQAEIVIDQFDDAIYVPVQAIVRSGTQHVAYVRNGRDFEKTPVQIGSDNNRMVRVISGLSKNQEVLLTPPLEPSAIVEDKRLVGGPETEQMKQHIEESKRIAAAQPQRGPAAGTDRGSGEGWGGDDRRGEGPRAEGRRGEGRRGDGQRGDRVREGGDGRRGGFGNMTPEQREEMRKRFENMSPEEREAARERRRGPGDGNGR